jgi:glycine cleavage system H protein
MWEATTMAGYPTDLRYTQTHHWVRAREKLVTVGITQFTADRLGEISFVELPYAGELFRTDARIGRMSGESAAAPIHMPFTGHVNAINQALSESPGMINSDPYGEGWLVRIEPGDPADVDGLMDAAAYEAFVSANEE